MMHNTGIKSGSTETTTEPLTVSGPQPAWMTLDEARDRAFTGEIVFEVDPQVLVYLDNGVTYYAERVSDDPLGRRLLAAGVVDIGQLERGTVRVGDVEHLGRLFDRDESVDRDAVLVVTETSTEALIAELANHAVTTARVTAYRHHPSGVHRWFVAQLDTAPATPKMAPATKIDGTVVDELPGLDLGADELTIEWDEFDDGPTDVASLPEVEDVELIMFDPFREGSSIDAADDARREVEAASVDFTDPPVADSFVPVGERDEENVDVVLVDDDLADVVLVDDDLVDFDFEVAWPDGTDVPLAAPPDLADEPQGADAQAATLDESPVFVENADGELHFEIPSMELTDGAAVSDEVPDNVAAAVRRAIAAIESAAAAPALPTLDEPIVGVPVAAPVAAPAAAEITTQFAAVEPGPAPAGLGGFAPPTMDMRAEVMYARMEETAAAGEAVSESPIELAPEAVGNESISAPTPPSEGVASVVFVDEEHESEPPNERSSALHRLIGSLRRKDH